MKRILKITGLVVASLLLIVIVGGLISPAHWEVQVSDVINAPASKVFPLLNTPATWDKRSG